jgi:hypothetical protein
VASYSPPFFVLLSSSFGFADLFGGSGFSFSLGRKGFGACFALARRHASIAWIVTGGGAGEDRWCTFAGVVVFWWIWRRVLPSPRPASLGLLVRQARLGFCLVWVEESAMLRGRLLIEVMRTLCGHRHQCCSMDDVFLRLMRAGIVQRSRAAHIGAGKARLSSRRYCDVDLRVPVPPSLLPLFPATIRTY